MMFALIFWLAISTTCEAISSSALNLLSGKTFRCAMMHWALPGDAFVRLSQYSQVSKSTLQSTVAMGSTFNLSRTDITGMNVQTLEALRLFALDTKGVQFKFEYYWYRLDDYSSTQTSEIIDALSRFDCLFTNLIVDPERLQVSSFLFPHLPYSYQVMTSIPTAQPASVYERFYLIASPFSFNLWMGLLGLVLCSSLFIGVFEGDRGVNEFEFDWWTWQEKKQKEKRRMSSLSLNQVAPDDIPNKSSRMKWRDKTQSAVGSTTFQQIAFRQIQETSMSFVSWVRRRFDEWADRFGYGFYRGITVIAQGEGIHAVTVAGRIYMSGMALCFLVFTASYTAQLTANFTSDLLPTSTITQMSDFITNGATCCVRNTTTHLAFMKLYWPSVKIYITNPTEESLAAAIKAGRCQGAISTGPHLKYFLNTNSELGCKMQLVGPPMGGGYYAIAFNQNINLDALNLLMVEIQYNGQLDAIRSTNFPETSSLICPSSTLINGKGISKIDFMDLAGMFVLQGFLAGLGIIVHIISKIKRKHLQHVTNLKQVALNAVDRLVDGSGPSKSAGQGRSARFQEDSRGDLSPPTREPSYNNNLEAKAPARDITLSRRVGRRAEVERKDRDSSSEDEFDKARRRASLSPVKEVPVKEEVLPRTYNNLKEPPAEKRNEKPFEFSFKQPPSASSYEPADSSSEPAEIMRNTAQQPKFSPQSYLTPPLVYSPPPVFLPPPATRGINQPEVKVENSPSRISKLPFYHLPPIIDYSNLSQPSSRGANVKE